MTYSQADITVPYAVANFAEIRHKGYYYVDKTNYIPLLERYKAPVFLRPRRFGKSLLISFMDAKLHHLIINRLVQIGSSFRFWFI